MSFRTQDKELLTIKVPVDLNTALRESAARDRRSMSEIVSEALCLLFGFDTEQFGIEASDLSASR